MTSTEKLIKVIREQGAVNNPTTLMLATAVTKNSIKLGDLDLDKDDLIFSESTNGNLEFGDTVLVYQISEEKYVVIERLVM